MGVTSDGNSKGPPTLLVPYCDKSWELVEAPPPPSNDFSGEKMGLAAKEPEEEKESAFECLSSA